jgi:glyoxylase-like metal-dependent hydrolase (beta-lactamase superfamily II)
MTEIAPGLHRLGTELVNWYLLERYDQLVVFDAGYPRYYEELDAALRLRGRQPGDISAVLLTHADPDHIGFAERLRREGVPVYLHNADAALARLKSKKTEARLLPNLRNRAFRRHLGHALRSGMPRRVREFTPIHDGDVLDVPGNPRVVHVPGHSEGSCAFYLAEQRVLVAGDAFCMLSPVTGETGPQIPPPALNFSTAMAGASLERLAEIAELDAGLVLPGHGDPWRGSVRDLVESLGISAKQPLP